MWPMVVQKLETLNKAGLTKDNFHEADSEALQQSSQSSQKGIDDYFQPLQDQDLAALLNDDFEDESSQIVQNNQLNKNPSQQSQPLRANTHNSLPSPPKQIKLL